MPGSVLVFSYVLPSLVGDNSYAGWSGALVQQLSNTEPWLFGLAPHDLPGFLDTFGLRRANRRWPAAVTLTPRDESSRARLQGTNGRAEAGMAHPSPAVIAEIGAMRDPIGRNFAITRCYRDLALAVAGVLGRNDVNWLAFGAWASGTAGAAIRGEGLLLDWGTSAALAEGNRTIITDIAPRFVRWLDEIELAGRPSRNALEVALGDSLFDDAPELRLALLAYQAALEAHAVTDAAPSPDIDRAVAEYVLLGNVRIAAHEQQLADSLIDRAMPLGGLFGLVTTRFVQMVTPDGPVDVCRDVPRPSYLGGRTYPASLDRLTNVELCELARRFHHAIDTDIGASDAASWESFEERMGYIFAFFRAFARDLRFFEVPDAFLGGDGTIRITSH